MVNFEQYPHTLAIKVTNGITEPTQDEEGNWILPSSQPIEKHGECRAEPNGDQKKIIGVNGDKIDFSFLVYAPTSCPGMEEGIKITIKDGEEIIYQGKVIRFFKGQLHTQIWV